MNAETEPDWSRVPGHHVTLNVEPEGCGLRMHCDAPKGAHCRLSCAEECGAESWPCYNHNEDGTDREHEMHDGGFCNVIEYVHAGSADASEMYDGPSLDSATVPSLVQVRWSVADESYVWRFPPVPA